MSLQRRKSTTEADIFENQIKKFGQKKKAVCIWTSGVGEIMLKEPCSPSVHLQHYRMGSRSPALLICHSYDLCKAYDAGDEDDFTSKCGYVSVCCH